MYFRCRLVVYLMLLVAFGFGMQRLDKEPGNGLTKADVEEVYNNLQKYTGLPGSVPPLIVLDDSVINAWINPEGLTITTGILHFVKNKDELAAVIGHEMGHYVLGHLQDVLTDDSRVHEANADKFGVYLMMRAGYDPCQAQEVWKRFDEKFGDDILTGSHPSPAQRTWELDFPMCSDVF